MQGLADGAYILATTCLRAQFMVDDNTKSEAMCGRLNLWLVWVADSLLDYSISLATNAETGTMSALDIVVASPLGTYRSHSFQRRLGIKPITTLIHVSFRHQVHARGIISFSYSRTSPTTVTSYCSTWH